MPGRSISQRERTSHAIVGHRCAISHLRLDERSFIGAKKGVVVWVAVVACDVRGGGDRIQAPEIGLRHENAMFTVPVAHAQMAQPLIWRQPPPHSDEVVAD